MADPIKRYELNNVVWREYEFDGAAGRVTYRIEEPTDFYWAPGHTTHRVVDSLEIVHIVPAPGENGCVVRYLKRIGERPVEF